MNLLNNNLSRIEFLVSGGSIEEAERLSSDLIKIYPQHALLLQYRGVIFALLNKHKEAIKCYEKVLKKTPNNLDCMLNLASSLNTVGENIKALSFLDRVISVSPKYFEAHYNKGNVLNDLGMIENAITSFEQAVSINPRDPRAHHNLAKCLHDIGRFELAVVEYDKAISLDSNYAEAWSNKGVTLLENRQYADAIICLDTAIALTPRFAPAYSNKGLVLHALKDFDGAIAEYDKAISLDSSYAEAWSNKGVTLLENRKYADAIICLDTAIALTPRFAPAYSNKGLVLHALKDFDGAIAEYDKAISLDSNYAEAYLNKSFSELLLGRFDSGWKNFEYRWKLKEFDAERHAVIPRLSSLESIEHKKILIWAEQGLGDSIQFFRFVLLLCDLGAHVVFEAPESLVPIFSKKENLEVVTEAVNVDFDFQLPLLSLPLIFDVRKEVIPNNINYIDINPEKINLFSAVTRSEKPYKIGLVCSGHKNHRNDMNRSIPLHQFASILDQGHQYFLIQKEIRLGDEDFLKDGGIESLAHCINDFSDTAAIILNLDCVISVDTSVIHLAGVLNKKAFLLLPFCPDWRWQVDRGDTPWYPSIKIIRQTKIDDWSQALEELQMTILNLAN
ncbi:tetratricopeptide repeat protein [Polynucleobacter sp. AP-Ainpum-60-G11]|uniref:tetratricopeptide repeat protein n=1 Tax=Polynucleobacter sp. AP-Ainpum-60-G11 TaxID=2576926 RepID=UPI001BFCF640|nr:tetratricopeptide repeat protein [Polynucleobacter sp. AP-Ainpum-60-G11]QWE26841.1 tetratricopeptide repeat protein [Polynucleobacter sp. AP-Ainpum-60-G11]